MAYLPGERMRVPSLFSLGGRDLLSLFDDLGKAVESGSNGFPMDVEEREDRYLVHADIPGNKDDIHVTMEQNQLTITVERSQEEEKTEGKWVVKERRRESMRRSLYLPNAGRSDEIAAKHENGVLTVVVPKSVEKKARKVAIS